MSLDSGTELRSYSTFTGTPHYVECFPITPSDSQREATVVPLYPSDTPHRVECSEFSDHCKEHTTHSTRWFYLSVKRKNSIG